MLLQENSELEELLSSIMEEPPQKMALKKDKVPLLHLHEICLVKKAFIFEMPPYRVSFAGRLCSRGATV